MSTRPLGKFKKTLKECCPICGKHLEVRTTERKFVERGVDKISNDEYVRCSSSSCAYERDIIKKKKFMW